MGSKEGTNAIADEVPNLEKIKRKKHK